MRLIDADKLMQDIRNTITEQSSVIGWLNLINRQPTAYDVDAVVGKLKQQAEQYHSRAEKYASVGVNHEVEHMAGKAASYEHAIEIVKGGGV